MLGLAAYGSDDGSSSESEAADQPQGLVLDPKAEPAPAGDDAGAAGAGAGGGTDHLLAVAEERWPPEPSGVAAPRVVEQVAVLAGLARKRGWNLFAVLEQRSTDFGNPAYFDGLQSKYDIDGHGSNFAAEIFDPSGYSRSNVYHRLRSRQERAELRRAEENKSRREVAFVPPTIPPAPAAEPVPATIAAPSDRTAIPADSGAPRRRRSRWDSGAPES